MRIYRGEIREPFGELIAARESEAPLLHFEGVGFRRRRGCLVGLTLRFKRAFEARLDLHAKLLKHDTLPSPTNPAYYAGWNLTGSVKLLTP